MKKIALIIAFFGLCTQTSFAQLSKEELKAREKEMFLNKKNTLSLSPFNIMFKQMQFSYERRFGNRNSFMLVSSILHNRDAAYNSAYGYNFGFAAELHYRKYIYSTTLRRKKNPDSQNTMGVYAAPFAGYQYLERELVYPNLDLNGDYIGEFWDQSYQNAVQIGLVGGVHFHLLKGRLSLDFYGGFAEKLSFVGGPSAFFGNPYFQNYPGVLQFDVFGIIPKANMQIGFNF